jgi:hypothetical protein
VCRVKPPDVGITKIKDPKVGAKGVFFCFWVISSLRALPQIKPWPLFSLPLTGMEKKKKKKNVNFPPTDRDGKRAKEKKSNFPPSWWEGRKTLKKKKKTQFPPTD